jgi:hypothetical protein
MKYIIIILLFITSKNEFQEKQLDSNNCSSIMKEIGNNYMKFWAYYKKNINYTIESEYYDNKNIKISKADYLKFLTTGKYMPFRIKIKSKTAYKICLVEKWKINDIKTTIVNESKIQLHYFELENTLVPINDNDKKLINNKNNKNILIKTWFIKCQACEEQREFLNKLVENNKNICFTSFVFDKDIDIKKHLKTHPTKYSYIIKSKSFFENELKINTYPVYILCNNKYKIIKIFDDIKHLNIYLSSQE